MKNTDFDHFKIVKKIFLFVPEIYDPDIQLAKFKSLYRSNPKGLNLESVDNNYLLDRNFPRPQHILRSRLTYEVSIVGLLWKVEPSDCLKYAKYNKGFCAGIQGDTLFWQEKRKELPDHARLNSFSTNSQLMAVFRPVDGEPGEEPYYLDIVSLQGLSEVNDYFLFYKEKKQ
jgi:hypothetical protein